MGQIAKRRSGKQTRDTLLQAAFLVISRVGLQRVSHREVAREAGASPALTTYYFSSKDDLILQTFERYVARGVPITSALWQQAYDVLDKIEQGLPKATAARQLAELAANFLCLPQNRQREEIAFEMAFFHQPRLEPELAKRVRAYRSQMRQPALIFCQSCLSKDPETDADLLMGLIARLQFEQLSQTIDVSVERAAQQFERLVGMIMGLDLSNDANQQKS